MSLQLFVALILWLGIEIGQSSVEQPTEKTEATQQHDTHTD